MFKDIYNYDVEKDPSGRKYRIAESMGEDVRMGAIVRWPDGRSVVYQRPHYVSDGAAFLGDLFAFLERQGHLEPTPNRLSKARKQKPERWKLPLQAFRYLQSSSSRRPAWRAPRETSTAPGFAILRFDRTQYRELVKRASAASANPYSLLFSILQKTVAAELLQAGTPQQQWLLPVNMRPALQIAEMRGNMTSSLILALSGTATPAEINAQVMRMSRQGTHFGAWLFSNLSNYVGDEKLRGILAKDNSRYVGVFSNNGTFIKDAKFELVPIVPCTRFAPVSANFLVTGSVGNFTLQLHPKLGFATAEFAACVQARIEQELGAAMKPSFEALDPQALFATAVSF